MTEIILIGIVSLFVLIEANILLYVKYRMGKEDENDK